MPAAKSASVGASDTVCGRGFGRVESCVCSPCLKGRSGPAHGPCRSGKHRAAGLGRKRARPLKPLTPGALLVFFSQRPWRAIFSLFTRGLAPRACPGAPRPPPAASIESIESFKGPSTAPFEEACSRGGGGPAGLRGG